MPIYGGDDDRQMGGRCIVGNYSVTRITAILASTSPFSAAVKRGPLGTLFVGLHADIVEQKCYTRETGSFVNQTFDHLLFLY